MNDDPEVDISEYTEVLLSSLILPDHYVKLIKRMNSAFNYSGYAGASFTVETVGNILQLAPHQVAKYPGVGKKYVDTLIAFKKELPSFLNITKQKAAIIELPPLITLLPTQLETPIAQLAFPAQYQKLIKRISVVAVHVVTVQDLINLDPTSFAELPTVGKLYVQNLIELKKQLPDLLRAQAKKFESFNSIELNEIDNILIEDIERYLWTLDERKIDIALSRWGFNNKHETLQEVANRYDIERERIRQIEKPINTQLALHLTIQPKALWANIRANMAEDLTMLLPNLAKCFATDKLFYAFIELCCQVEAGSISKIFLTKIRSEIIDLLFCSTPSPVAQEIIINELMSNYGYD